MTEDLQRAYDDLERDYEALRARVAELETREHHPMMVFDGSGNLDMDATIAKARADEREACARVCENRARIVKDNPDWNDYNNKRAMEANQCAAAIRARSD